MKQSKFICSLPFEHISVHPHGVCSICCEANFSSPQSFATKEGKILNVNEGVENIINSDTYKEIRKQMLNGEVPDACLKCHKVEQAGGFSKRQYVTPENTEYNAEEDGTIAVDLKNIELRLGNYCNLKCRGCNAESSTSWIPDYHKLKDKVRLQSNYDLVLKDPSTDYSWAESEDFYADLFKFTNELDLLQISGGEPFLVDKHSALLDKLIDDGQSKNITVSYITNANYKIERIHPILEKLKRFKHVHISISIDDVGPRNTYMRGLSSWKLTIDNLKKLTENYKFDYTITQTFNIYNFLYFEQLEQFLISENIKVPININHIFDPDCLSINALPLEIRREKIDSVKGKVSDYIYDDMYGKYYNTECNNLIKDFYTYTVEVDKIRNQSLEKTLPELFNVITPLLNE